MPDGDELPIRRSRPCSRDVVRRNFPHGTLAGRHCGTQSTETCRLTARVPGSVSPVVTDPHVVVGAAGSERRPYKGSTEPPWRLWRAYTRVTCGDPHSHCGSGRCRRVRHRGHWRAHRQWQNRPADGAGGRPRINDADRPHADCRPARDLPCPTIRRERRRRLARMRVRLAEFTVPGRGSPRGRGR